MNAVTQALSAALIHLIWQGTLVGCVLWIVLHLLKDRSANARYVASCVALAAVTLAFALTVIGVLSVQAPSASRLVSSGASPTTVVGIPQTMLPIWIEPAAPRLRWLAWVQIWALPIWSVGVLVCSVRLALGCAHAFTLGRRGETGDEPLRTIVATVARRMHISRPVRVLMSVGLDGPSVLGWLHPVILLPPAAAMGLTPQQLEAVIAHELAHISRHDYLINVLQAVVETLFFYHPMVWWISAQIRAERELCCDDLAVRCCGDALGYAKALTTLAKMQLTAPTLAVSSTGGSLLRRIQRLLEAPSPEYRPSRWLGVLALCLGLGCVGLNMNWERLLAQTGAETPRFEVASVKPNTSSDPPSVGGAFLAGGRYRASNVTVRALIRETYSLQGFQIVGGPSWITADRFDIVAKAAGNPEAKPGDPPGPPAIMFAMLRTLLAERFKLTVHTETRQLPIYAIVMARGDRRPGPQLRPPAIDCTTFDFRNAPPPPGGFCGGIRAGRGTMMGKGATMRQLALNLSPRLGRIVVDQTALNGAFDLDLDWTPTAPADAPATGTPPSTDVGPDIFTAMEEQLGLKLESQRGPVDVLVVDSVEHPTEN